VTQTIIDVSVTEELTQQSSDQQLSLFFTDTGMIV